jgi:uncharacterized protein (DUF305 family)
MLRHRVILVSVVLSSLVAACGGSDESSTPAETDPIAASTTAPDGAAPGAYNEADTELAQGMIAHHEQAIEMAEIALDPTAGASPAVVDLATRIKAAQGPEVEQLLGWLNATGQPTVMDTSAGHDMSDMEGMMSAEDMETLSTLTGAEFDTMWLEMMIAHHEGAISQSQKVRSDGSAAELIAMADMIITAQQGEIEEMNALLGK